MSTRNPDLHARPSQAGADDDDAGFDLEQLKELAGYFVRSPRRRPRLAVLAFVLVAAGAVLVAVFYPRAYDCDVRILAQKNLVLPALGNPGRSIPREADNPTKNVADIILQRDNLVALVKQLDLVDRWDATRAPILRLKDRLTSSVFGPPTEEERLRSLVGVLERRLWVNSDESSITIGVDWANPQIAFELISVVQKNFVDARYDSDVNVITEAIRILDERARAEAANVDAALSELVKLQDTQREAVDDAAAQTTPPSSAPRVPIRRRPTGAAVAAAPDSQDVKNLEDVRARIRTLEGDRLRQLTAAQNQLAEARLTLGPLHPTVLGLNEKIDQLSKPSPELSELKSQERTLVARLAAPAAPSDGSTSAPGDGAKAPAVEAPRVAAPRPGSRDALVAALVQQKDDPQTAVARAKLSAETTKYNDLLSRIESADIELDVARAAFKYKYTVVRPPELPRSPRKPNVPVVLVGGLAAAFLAALLLSGGVDLLRGRFVEPWQVRRRLKLPVLGELTPPPS